MKKKIISVYVLVTSALTACVAVLSLLLDWKVPGLTLIALSLVLAGMVAQWLVMGGPRNGTFWAAVLLLSAGTLTSLTFGLLALIGK